MENRPGVFWWWMGSAVDKENLTWNLQQMHDAGIGGATIVPIYGVRGHEERYLQHLSPQFVDMVSHASSEAKRLGMWVDMTTGTGWPFGGPMIADQDADASVVYRNGVLSQKFSGRRVKRAAPGNEGKAVNPFSARAVSQYLRAFDAPFGREGVVMPRAMYHDSYEFSGNWCRELPDEFKRRRGYDLMDHLPELFGKGDPEVVARIKADYRETLSDLHLDYLNAWVRWSESKGCTTRNQAHGSPANLLDLYASAGIPETEIFGASRFEIPGIRREAADVDGKNEPQPLINRMASSAAHVAGKPLVAAETCTWIRNHFRTSLAMAKPEIDRLFLSGINHVFFHGTCYSPKDAPWPGWLFYASFQYNPRNAIWRDAPLLNTYVTRCQSILQSGVPDNDVALYWPVHDLWHDPTGMQRQLTVHDPTWLTQSPCGLLAAQLGCEGFAYDFISDRQLLAGQADDYRVIVVPKTLHMPVETMKALLDRSAKGQAVIFVDALPADVPGYHDLENRRAALKHLLSDQGPRVVQAQGLKQALIGSSVRCEPMTELGLEWTRRRHEAGCHYFIANLSAKAVNGWVPLGVPFTSAVILDPRSGQSGVASVRARELYLQLEPGESRILRTFDRHVVEGAPWPVLTKAGDSVEIGGPWVVSFIDGGPVLPAGFTTDTLKSWTENGDVEAKRFAGTARYATTIEIPHAADEWWIDLGDVRESARVFIDGEQVAGLFSVPFRASIGRHLQAGQHRLEIEVTNLSSNRIRDLDIRKVQWKTYHEINFVDQNYKPFDASSWPLAPSGLLGPVTLTPMKMELLPGGR